MTNSHNSLNLTEASFIVSNDILSDKTEVFNPPIIAEIDRAGLIPIGMTQLTTRNANGEHQTEVNYI